MTSMKLEAIIKHRGSWEKTTYRNLTSWEIDGNVLCLLRQTQASKDAPLVSNTFIIPMNLIECAEICSSYGEEMERENG